MKRWQTKQLGEICRTTSGGTPSRGNSSYFEGEIPWVKSGELKDNVIFDIEESITRAGLDNSSAKLFPKGTLLIALYGATVGQLGFLGRDAATNQAVCAIFPDEDLLQSRFLFYFLLGKREELVAQSFGGGQPNISQTTVRNLFVPVPPLAEQERIVKLLDEADALRKLRTQADRRTAKFIPALFHKMFGDPLENPKRWPIKPVASFVEHFQGGRSLTPAEANEVNGPYRVLKISAVTWGEFRPDENKPVSAKYQPPADHFVRTSDLLFSRANTTELVAATSYVFETPPNLLLPDKLWRFVWKQPQIVDPLFVWWLFQTSSVRAELGRRASGTGGSMKNISQPKVMSLEVPVPPLPLQKEFAERVKEIRELESTQTRSRARLDALFASLLDKAFKGEL
jgi:type I restriction enzyme, S subunit